MFAPFDYQTEALTAIEGARCSQANRALVVMASGLGKTVVAALDVLCFLKGMPKDKVLYLCHQSNILAQARTTFETTLAPENTHAFLLEGIDTSKSADIVYATFQAMHKRRTLFTPNHFSYIVVDESHHGPAPTYLPTLEYFKPRFMLGITATPDRMDQQDIGKIFGDPIFVLNIEEAWARGLLTPVEYRVITDEWQDTQTLSAPIGRLSIKQLNKTIFARSRDDEIIRIINEKAASIENPKIVIFDPRISHCEYLAGLISGSIAIHSKLSQKEQLTRLDMFRSGGYHCVITVDMFNEGIDIPEANVIVFLRSTSSRTVFLQQLGRGLRLNPNKDHVMVLDFVANCDRLILLDELRSAVIEHQLRLRITPHESPTMIDTSGFVFNEISRDIIDVLGQIRQGYSNEVLLRYLRELAADLSRTPRMSDVDSHSLQGLMPSSSTYVIRFGSFNNALLAAGLNIVRRGTYTKDEILAELLRLRESLGHNPSYYEVRESSKTSAIPDPSTITNVFGSWRAAQIAAGFNVKLVDTTKRGILRDLRSLAQELGRTPTINDIDANSDIASFSTIALRFGSYNDALKAAQLKPNFIVLTDEELLNQLKNLAGKLGRTPRNKEITEASIRGETSAIRTYYLRFGSVNNAIRAAGLKPNRTVGTSQQIVLSELKKLAVSLQRTPTYREINLHSKTSPLPRSDTIKRMFGSLTVAFQAADIEPRTTWSRHKN